MTTLRDLTAPSQIGAILRDRGLRPDKSLGQNFLCDLNHLHRIVRAADLRPGEPVLEIGAGLGCLTAALAEAGARVTTVEIDRRLEPHLRETFGESASVALVFDDFLRVRIDELLDRAFGPGAGVVVANTPYYVTTPIIERLLSVRRRLARIVMLVQREVAHRLAAGAGTPEYGSLSAFVQYQARVELAGSIPPTAFYPPPAVESEMVVLTPAPDGTVRVRDERTMFHLIRTAFAQRRKTLLNALLRAPASYAPALPLPDRVTAERLLGVAGIDAARRGETLSVAEFATLADVLAEANASPYPTPQNGVVAPPVE